MFHVPSGWIRQTHFSSPLSILLAWGVICLTGFKGNPPNRVTGNEFGIARSACPVVPPSKKFSCNCVMGYLTKKEIHGTRVRMHQAGHAVKDRWRLAS